MDVINPDDKNQSNLNYWDVTDKNKDGIVDLSDLKEIINYLSAGNQQTAVFKQQLISGVHYAPFLVANGGSADNPNFSDTYFAYNGLNTDGVNHVRRISDNIFGFEDLRGGGDNDFNDIIVSLSVI